MPSAPPACLQELKLAEAHVSAGRLAEAETVLRQILKADPNQPDALTALAALALNVGRLDVAIKLQQRAVAARPDAPLYLSNLGEMHRRAGNLALAVECGAKAVALRPSFAGGHNNLGVAYVDSGDPVAALKCYDAALRRKSDFPEAHNNRGNALRALDRLNEAEAALRRAIALRPDYAGAHLNLGHVLRDLGRAADAVVAYKHSLTLKPGDIGALSSLAAALTDLARTDEADVVSKTTMATALRALELDPGNAEAANALGLMYAARGRQNEAADAFAKATAKAGYVEAWVNLGNALKEAGRFEEALSAFDRARELAPRAGAPLLGLAQVKTFRDPADPHLAAMRKVAGELESLPPAQRIYLHFALGKAYDDLGDADAAFTHLHAGNMLKRHANGYDEAKALDLFERIKRTFDAACMTSADAGAADATPIFVIGMPRSGTTLVEQIISSHPHVGAAGEISALNEVARDLRGFPEIARSLAGAELARAGDAYVQKLRAYAPDAAHITDKTPSNMSFVGLIHLMLPNARIVHVRRDPVDTCFSCYSKLFTREQRYSYDLGELGRYYRAYHDLMRHWRDVLPSDRMLEVRYEDVVADTEGEARRLLTYCGLEWDDCVLAFYRNERAVKTASASQVRQPIYASSVARWRRYEKHLQPLLDALGDLVRS